MSSLHFFTFNTPIGELTTVSGAGVLRYVVKDREAFLSGHEAREADASSLAAQAAGEILRFLTGQSQVISTPYETGGTPFQRRVWAELCRIPYGETASYTEIATRIGNPASFRAVANACATNPLPLVVPCHRVVHKNNNVSGFAWGVETKRTLLSLEASRATLQAA